MPTLTVTRQSARADRDQPFRLLVDNQERGQLGDGETLRVDLPDGTHRVQLTDRAGSSPALAVAMDHDVRLGCRSGLDLLPGRGPFFYMRALTFGRNEYIKLWVEDGSPHG